MANRTETLGKLVSELGDSKADSGELFLRCGERLRVKRIFERTGSIANANADPT